MTEVDQSPTATVESADHMGGLLAAMIASWEMNGGEAKAEVDIVMPFLMGEGCARVWVGESMSQAPVSLQRCKQHC